MENYLNLTATQARAALQKKEISATELIHAYIAAADATKALNNYVCMTADKALEMAANSDKRIADGSAGPLEGLPIGVKDLFCTAGVKTTACSAILKDFVPAYESTVTSKLWRGAVMLGKLNCDEFAWVLPMKHRFLARRSIHGVQKRRQIWRLAALQGFGLFCGGRVCADGDRHGYRRVNSPACCILRGSRRDNLWALLALGTWPCTHWIRQPFTRDVADSH